MRDRYARLVELSNQGARELGYTDTGALWRSGYDMTPEQFSAELERVWKQVEPLYAELHTYVRRKLIEKYGAAAQRNDGMIPADLLGNMWAQEWGNIYDLVAPPSAPPAYDIGEILQQRKTTAKQVVQYGEGFFRSMGLQTLPDTFWERSLFTRPADRDVVCHASAWHVDYDKDVRLKVCLRDTTDDFITVHHELGHVYYFLAYRNQPFLFRSGANDGFHEAIGDSIALSITPEYLKKIGLIETVPPPAADVPLLLRTALDKIAFLPFGLMIDKWRWEVFSGQVKPADYNKSWWKLREQYQGVAPPVDRTRSRFRSGREIPHSGECPLRALLSGADLSVPVLPGHVPRRGLYGPVESLLSLRFKSGGRQAGVDARAGTVEAVAGSDEGDDRRGPHRRFGDDRVFQPLLTWLKEQNKGQKTGWTVEADPLKAN